MYFSEKNANIGEWGEVVTYSRFDVRTKLRVNAMLSSSRQSMSCPTPIGHLLTQRLKIFAANVAERCLNVENRIWIEHVESFLPIATS